MCNSIINHRLSSPTGDGDARQPCASPATAWPTSFRCRSRRILPAITRCASGEGGGATRGKFSNPLTGTQGPGLAHSAEPQTGRCTWESCARIRGHVRGRAGGQGSSCAQESWAPGAGKPGSRGSNATESLVPGTEADLLRGNSPYFLLSIPDPLGPTPQPAAGHSSFASLLLPPDKGG